jgi:DNA helicase-2/ATP-dependent DNA helicase PcrA
MLFELLHFDWFDIEPIAIAKETIEVANARYDKNNPINSLRQLLAQKSNNGPQDLFDNGMHAEIKKVIISLEKLLKDAHNETLQNVVQNIFNELNVLKYVMDSNEKHWHLQILTAFFNLVKQETHRNPALTLQQFVSMLQTMQQEKIVLPLYQINGTTKGVNLLTCHGSKGLEFTYVFMVGCNAHYWEGKTKRSSAYGIATYMQKAEVPIAENEEPINIDEEELRRLFYVAITRAEQQLHISFFKYKNDTKDAEQSMFVAEIVKNNNLVIKEETLEPSLVEEFSILEISNTAKPIIAKMEEDVIGRSLEKFTMNVTALNSYLNCPLGFYYKNLIKIPSPKNESTEFGSAVHHALDQLFKKMMDSSTSNADKKFPSLEILIADFVWYMHKHRESFTKEQFVKKMEYGPMILTDYYEKYVNDWPKVVSVEKTISKVTVKGVPIKGKIDKLEFEGKIVNVVDYKTGDYEKAKKIKKSFDAPNEKNELGGDYWRQAVFYKILIDNYDLKDWKVRSTEFDFIEPNKQKEYFKEKIEITPEDITTVTQQIKTVWDKIQNREFYTGCGKEDCHWCNFVKDNKLAIGFEEDVEEEPMFYKTDEE